MSPPGVSLSSCCDELTPASLGTHCTLQHQPNRSFKINMQIWYLTISLSKTNVSDLVFPLMLSPQIYQPTLEENLKETALSKNSADCLDCSQNKAMHQENDFLRGERNFTANPPASNLIILWPHSLHLTLHTIPLLKFSIRESFLTFPELKGLFSI